MKSKSVNFITKINAHVKNENNSDVFYETYLNKKKKKGI